MNIDEVLDQLSRHSRASFDVAELALELARDEYPELDVEAYLNELAGMAHEARKYVNGNLEKQVHGLCRYLFHDMGFRGNTRNYYDPLNSYFNQVLDRRTGLPITLSALVMAIGARVGVKVLGVGLPGHFVTKAVAHGNEVFFDPFHGGRVLSRENCEHLVQQVTGMSFQVADTDFEPIPLGRMVQRMLANLKAVYMRDNDFSRAVRVIDRMRQLDSADLLLRRDLGICLYQTGEPGRAIDHLSAYLTDAQSITDADTIQQFLSKARCEVAQWN
jgi:regulator of sirC expression with transglutaminase-like and TPR domain